MTIAWPRFVELIRSHQRFLLTSHIRPDCDALGSELGMAHVLEALGKDVRIVNGQGTPPNIAFIDPEKRIGVIHQTVKPEELADREILLVLDTSAWVQLGPMREVLQTTKAKKMILDHHLGSDDLGAEAFKNVQAEATGRLVMEAAEHLGVQLTEKMATPLYAAIATDTGWYRFPSTTSETYRLAAKLMDAGAKPAAIYNALYEQDTLGRMKLRGGILARIVAELEGRLAYTHVLLEDFEKTGSLPSDTEDAINMLLAIAGTQVAVIFVQLPGDAYKVSFRSRCDVDCSRLAEQFAGGGHKAAAGATMTGSLADVQSRVLDSVRKAMR
jgi:bifunctional oligoribonuclease and PAP phosphatase NrnA